MFAFGMDQCISDFNERMWAVVPFVGFLKSSKFRAAWGDFWFQVQLLQCRPDEFPGSFSPFSSPKDLMRQAFKRRLGENDANMHRTFITMKIPIDRP